MAQMVFHISVGLAAGTAALLPSVLRRLKDRENMTGPIRNWLMVAYGLGAWAALPSLLRRIGVSDGWWMNVFLFHPLINKLKAGGMLVGETVVVFCFVLQYVIILVAIARLRKKNGE